MVHLRGVAIFKDDVHSLTFDVNGGDDAGEASQVTIEKDLTADVGVELSDNAGSAKLTIGGAGRASTTSDTGQTITGDIEAGGDGQGEIVVDNRGDGNSARPNNNKVTFTGSVGADGAELRNLTVNQNAKVTLNQPVYMSGTLTLNTGTTIALGSGLTAEGRNANQSFITVGDYSFGAGDYDSDANKVKLILPVSFTSGTQTIFSAHTTLEKDKFTFAGNNLVNYTYNFNGDGTAVTVTAKGFKSSNEVASKLGVSSSEASAVIAASSAVKDLSDESPIRKLLQEVAQTGNEAKGKRLAEQLAPQTTALSGAATAVVRTGTQVAGVFTDRLSAQRSGGTFAQSGFATGGHGMDKAFWLKPFGSWGKQSKNTKQKIAGYSTTAKGLAVGVDAPVGDKVRVGTAVAYSTSTIKGKGAGQDTTDVKSWQVALYGDYSTARYYVEGQLGFGRNAVSTASRVAFLTRKAEYDTTSIMASVGGGLPLTLTPSTTLTPTAGVSWTRVGSANYTTKGASVLNQKIAVSAIDAVVGRLGTQVQRKITRMAAPRSRSRGQRSKSCLARQASA